MYSIHHVAVTASDFEKSLEFYERLGFKTLIKRDVPEKQKKIALLSLGNLKLELFWYADFEDHPESRDTMGNSVKQVGQKHFALKVDSLQEARVDLTNKGIDLVSEPDIGDCGYDFFFIRDPDGIWIEIVENNTHA